MRSRWPSLFVAITLAASTLSAQRLRRLPDGPPALPLPAPFSSRGAMLGPQHWKRVAQDATDPNQQTVMLPLSAGISMISIPLRTQSQLLSDLLPNLPDGSRVWTWDAIAQQFVEGFDQELPLGQGAILYVPTPAVITITGDTDFSTEIPVDLQNGWNLVGVPYGTPLSLSSQTVYAEGISTPFNDAVNQGDLQDWPVSIAVDASGGFQKLGPDDSFQPMAAYWVFSNDAELLELQPGLLGAEPFTKAWALDKLGGLVVQFAASQLFAQLEPDPNQAVLDQLAAISQQIQNVQDTQSFMVGQLSNLERAISLTSAEIQQKIGEQPIEAVRSKLETQYDGVDPNNPDAPPAAIDYGSYMWFVQTGLDPKEAYKITNQEKVRWDLKVLETEDYPTKFAVIKNAIIPLSGSGVLDNYAQQIVLGTKGGTLENRFQAMQEYFNTLLGLQFKCMVLITSALTDLANNPESPRVYSADSAENWRKTNYVPAIQKEVNRFRSAVETALVGSLVIGKKGDDPAVSVPRAVQDVAMRQADFMVMNLLQEAPGLRVRVLVSPDMNPNNTYSLLSGPYAYAPTLPSTDSGLWKRVNGVSPYDSWQIDNATSMPKFFVQKDWLMWKPASFPPITKYPCSNYQPCRFFINDAWKVTDQRPNYTDYNVRYVDAEGNPAQSGTPFGSLVLVLRASANSILTVKAGQKSGTCLNRSAVITTGGYPNKFSIQNCGGTMTISQRIPFLFGGGSPSLGDWEMNMDYQRDGNLQKWYGIIRLKDGDTILSDINTTFQASGTYSAEKKNIQWLTGRTYSFEMWLYHQEGYHVCTSTPCAPYPPASSSVTRKALVMRFQ